MGNREPSRLRWCVNVLVCACFLFWFLILILILFLFCFCFLISAFASMCAAHRSAETLSPLGGVGAVLAFAPRLCALLRSVRARRGKIAHSHHSVPSHEGLHSPQTPISAIRTERAVLVDANPRLNSLRQSQPKARTALPSPNLHLRNRVSLQRNQSKPHLQQNDLLSDLRARSEYLNDWVVCANDDGVIESLRRFFRNVLVKTTRHFEAESMHRKLLRADPAAVVVFARWLQQKASAPAIHMAGLGVGSSDARFRSVLRSELRSRRAKLG